MYITYMLFKDRESIPFEKCWDVYELTNGTFAAGRPGGWADLPQYAHNKVVSFGAIDAMRVREIACEVPL